MRRWGLMLVWLMAALLLATAQGARAADTYAQFLYRQDGKLYLYDVGAKQATELPGIETGKYDTRKWSPDGRYLAAGWYCPINRIDAYIRIYDVSQLSWVPDLELEGSQVYWSLDSKRFSFVRCLSDDDKDTAINELNIYDLNKQETRQVYRDTTYNKFIWRVQWSPDNQHLLIDEYYYLPGGFDGTLSLVNLKDKNATPTIIYNAYYGDNDPVWSPDGKWFLLNLQDFYFADGHFASEQGDYGDLYLYRAEDAKPFQLTHDSMVYRYNYRWSEDGKQIYFDFTDHRKTVAQLTASFDFEQALQNPAEIKMKVVRQQWKTPWNGEHYPSPDGTYMAFLQHYRDATYHLFVAKADGIGAFFTAGKLKDRYDDFLGWRPGSTNS
jgi:Tol biopolymer transport system component